MLPMLPAISAPQPLLLMKSAETIWCQDAMPAAHACRHIRSLPFPACRNLQKGTIPEIFIEITTSECYQICSQLSHSDGSQLVREECLGQALLHHNQGSSWRIPASTRFTCCNPLFGCPRTLEQCNESILLMFVTFFKSLCAFT